LLITLAGPAVNFLLAAALLPLVWHGLFTVDEMPLYSVASIIDQLWFANLIMGIFNLLPVFPMDGGRILRALLAIKLPYVRATYWAVMVGRVLSLGFALLALFYYRNPVTCVLFLFIFSAGNAEYKQLLRREEEARYWEEMARRASVVEPDAPDPRLPPIGVHGPN
jgi:Zn-dependent protease